MDIQLLVRVENKPEKKVTVSKDVIIGRSKTCQFRVLSNDVSREHCKLLVSDEVVAIRDLGSSNGTLVNGKTIPTGIDVLLHPGSNIEVGPLKFVVQFEAKHKIAPPPQPAAEKPAAPAATSTKPAKPKASIPDKPAAVAATTKTAAAAAKKKVAKKSASATAEPSFPFAAPVGETEDNAAWPDFLLGEEQAADEPSVEGPTVAAPTNEAFNEAPESDDFSFGGPPTADTEEPFFDFGGDDEPTVMPGVITPTATTPAPALMAEANDEPVLAGQTEAAAAVAQTASDDEPVFGEFNAGDDDSEFAFDPEAAAASPPVVPTTTPKPAAEQQPGKLKSLFGLFGKNKAATPTAVSAKPAATSPNAAAVPAAPAANGDDDGLNNFLTGGSEIPSGGTDDDDTPDWMKQLS